MHKRLIMTLTVLTTVALITACSPSPELPFSPATDRPTFLYFYTDS